MEFCPGNYLNPRNTGFQEALASLLYVDKSELITHTNAMMNTNQKYICISRPRRFGKTMAADMLTAYYSKGCESAALFHGLKIEADPCFQKHLNQHHVIRIDMQQFLFSEAHLDFFIEAMQEEVIEELTGVFGTEFKNNRYGLPGVLRKIYARTGCRFIIIIDEWDCVFRYSGTRQDVQKEYLDLLRALFKGAEYVELAYMTGILPIKKYGEHSALNVFNEYSMIDPGEFSEFFGFTEEEVQTECSRLHVDFTEMQQWYDGYLLKEQHIYNPKSVDAALHNKEFKSYWTQTETYDALKVYIERNFDGLKDAVTYMLGGGHVQINTRRFQNDMTTFKSKDDVLTLLVHLGYLTYHAKTQEVFIPNKEISQEFRNALDGAQWSGLVKVLDRSSQLLKDTWRLDAPAVAAGIERVHSETTSLIKFNDENSLACVICIAYYSAVDYYANPIRELPTGKGFADIVYLPHKNTDCPALLVELKWDQSAESAIQQIKEKHYTQWIESYTGEILLVGINYDQKSKKHSCVIEKVTKGPAS